MKLKDKLFNPFMLVGQGFLAGAALFYSTAADRSPSQPLPSAMQSSAAPQIAGI